MIRQWLVQLGYWLVKTFNKPGIEDELLTTARAITTRLADHWPDTDGEFKRAKAYAQLINTYPERNKRAISRAIEDAL